MTKKELRQKLIDTVKEFALKNKEHFDNMASFNFLMDGMEELENKHCNDESSSSSASAVARLMSGKKFVQEFFTEAYGRKEVDMDDIDIEKFISKINEKIAEIIEKDCCE